MDITVPCAKDNALRGKQKTECIKIKTKSNVKDKEAGQNADMFFYSTVDRDASVCYKEPASQKIISSN